MSRLVSRLVAAAIVVVALVVAVILVMRVPEPARQAPPSRVPFVETAPVEAGAGVIPVIGAGTVRPQAAVDVAAEVSGRVVWVASEFQSGGRVQVDDLLFQIDDADYLNRLEQAKAGVALQNLELQRVTAEAQVARAQFENPDAEGTPAPLALWEPQLEAARAALARDSAALAAAELALERTRVRAPFSGAVVEESISVGQFVAGGRSVGRMYATDTVEVVIPVSDASAALIPNLWALESGRRVRRVEARVTADYGDQRFEWTGFVDRADAALDARSRTINVVVSIPYPFSRGTEIRLGDEIQLEHRAGPPLLVGMFVDAHIDGQIAEPFFRVDRAALRPGNDIWVIRENAVRIVPVHVLQRSDDVAFVTGALVADELAIVGGLEFAIDGLPVRTEADGGS